MPSLQNKLKKDPKIIFIIVIFVFVFIILLISHLTATKQQTQNSNQNTTGLLGISGITGQIYNKKIEAQVGNVSNNIQNFQSQLNLLQKQNQALEDQNKLLNGEITHLNRTVDKKVDRKLDEAMGKIEAKISNIIPSSQQAPAPLTPQQERLQIITIPKKKIKQTSFNNKEIYLPAGSFVQGTLISGVFAPENKTTPLPVVFSVNQAFDGPSGSKIPVKGMLGIGKAQADINSQRAIIQVVRLAYVFPDGHVWEQKVNGWVCGSDDILGVKGKLIQNTGKALAGAFLSGFLSGTSQALSQAETSTQETTSGTYQTNVTGSTTKYGLYSGLASAAGNLSNYYSGMLNQIITAIKVKAGTPIEIIMEKGVTIETGNNYSPFSNGNNQ
ncbi:MAG: TraB/VirB10 family protein [Candidatus Omnitrophica bacterium]|jgi:hypothetical protein|nr:TraB/VirB10 family protein [Candidatus Omnitrophota bacterium]